MSLIVIIGALSLVASLLIAWWVVSDARSGATAAVRNLHLGLAAADIRSAQLAAPASERAMRPLFEASARLSRRIAPAGMMAALERRLRLAGLPATWPLERVLAGKLLLAVVGILLTAPRVLADPTMGGLVVTAVAGAALFFLPDVLLSQRATRRQAEIQLALPDTLDQLTISVEAGLGFDAALLRAGDRGSGPLAEELSRTMQDVQLGASTASALRDLAGRTDVPELRHFVAAIVQATSHGIAIAQVLRVQAAELRVKRSQRAEERAMKVPVKVLFPLMFCILPALFVVIIGPAVVRISGTGLGG